MAKRTWCLWMLVITLLLLMVGCGSDTTEADIKKLEDRIEALEEEARYIHRCAFQETHAHSVTER